MSDVKRSTTSSKGGRRKSKPKAESRATEVENVDVEIIPVTAAEEPAAQGEPMSEQREVVAADDDSRGARGGTKHEIKSETKSTSPSREQHDDERDDDRGHYADDDEDRELDDRDEDDDDRGPRAQEDFDRDDRGPEPRRDARGGTSRPAAPAAKAPAAGAGGRRDQRDSRDPRDARESGRREGAAPIDKSRPGEDFLLQIRYDKNARQFIATCVEVPDLKASANNKEDALLELEERLEDHLFNLRRDGRKIPEAVQARRYPERLEVRVSQNIQRRLDLLSRQEKVGLEQLVTELLTYALDRKSEPVRHEKNHNSHNSSGNRQGGNQGGRQGGAHPQHGRRAAGRNFHDTMENRENFMEYVRNLEKGNLKKR